MKKSLACAYTNLFRLEYFTISENKNPADLPSKERGKSAGLFVMPSVPNAHTYNLQFKQLGVRIVVANFCDNVYI